jgi:hypothetical protein
MRSITIRGGQCHTCNPPSSNSINAAQRPLAADWDNLPDSDRLTEEIAENLESALRKFRKVLRRLKE